MPTLEVLSLLKVENLNVAYGDTQVIWDVSFEVNEGEKISLIGPNGAGKTTLIKTLSGLVTPISGAITFLGEDFNKVPGYQRPQNGLVVVPEGRKLFAKMTVMENLEVASDRVDKSIKEKSFKHIFELLPRLHERRKQVAETLSGGEQQMLALGRAIMAQPKLLLLDEPSIGLAPKIVLQIFDVLRQLNKEGITIFLVEQYVEQALMLADRAYLCEEGRIVLHDKGSAMLKNDHVRKVYLGI